MIAKILENFDTKSEVIFLNKEAEDPRDSLTNLAMIKHNEKKQLVEVVFVTDLVKKDEVGIPPNVAKRINATEGSIVSVAPRSKPPSFDAIRRKYDTHDTWTEEEISTIVRDIYEGNSTDLEMAAFTLALQYEAMSRRETEFLTRSFANYGSNITFSEPVADKHSIGGIPGNKVSLLIVPIMAASGQLIPKTSSRAITSPSGTADTMEVLADVSFSVEEIEEIAPKTRGMIVWAGTLNLVPVDSEIISRVERPLRLDPDPVIIASILSKKLSLGVKNMVLDIPTGPGTKMETREDAITISRAFVEIGQRVGINIECALTYADQPVGRAIGPSLEAREALTCLSNKGSRSVREKSSELAGILFEMTKVAPRGQGSAIAHEYLKSGKALTKFREIIEAQGGNPNIKPEDIEVGQYTQEVYAPKDGYIASISNSVVKQVASALGCPTDKKAGMEFGKKAGEFVRKSDPILKLYTSREGNIDRALQILSSKQMFTYEGMVLDRIGPSMVE